MQDCWLPGTLPKPRAHQVGLHRSFILFFMASLSPKNLTPRKQAWCCVDNGYCALGVKP